MTNNKRYAVIFTGQGSQAIGMMSDFEGDGIFEATLEEASDTLGVNMRAVMNDERLNDTAFTQPAILTASIAIWRMLQKQLPYPPEYLAGHSLGEYSAFVAAGVIGFADAVALVHERGKLMSKAVLGIDTKIAAILGLEDEQVIELCRHNNDNVGVVNPANFNSKGQVVIAGTALGVNGVMNDVQNLGKKAVPLSVSVPSHCDLMNDACDQLRELLIATPFHSPNISVVQNLDAKAHHSTSDIKEALIRQLNHPVQWTKTMDKFADRGMQLMIECGFGNVLTNLAKRQNNPIACYATNQPTKINQILELL